MDSDRHAEILALRASGLTLQQIAERCGVSRQRVHQILRGGQSTEGSRKSERERIRRWRADNRSTLRERAREHTRRWHAEHPEVIARLAAAHRQREKLKGWLYDLAHGAQDGN